MSSQHGSFLHFFILVLLPILIVYPFWVLYRYKKKMYPIWDMDRSNLFDPSGKIFVIATIIVNMLIVSSIYGVKKGMIYLFTLDFLFIFLLHSMGFIVIIVFFAFLFFHSRKDFFLAIYLIGAPLFLRMIWEKIKFLF